MILNIQKRSVACWHITIQNLPIEFINEEMLDEFKSVILQLRGNKKLKVVIFECAVYDYFLARLALVRESFFLAEDFSNYFFICPDLVQFIKDVPFITIGIACDETAGAGNDFLRSLDYCFTKYNAITNDKDIATCKDLIALGSIPDLLPELLFGNHVSSSVK